MLSKVKFKLTSYPSVYILFYVIFIIEKEGEKEFIQSRRARQIKSHNKYNTKTRKREENHLFENI